MEKESKKVNEKKGKNMERKQKFLLNLFYST